ncbi:MAG: phenylalanine--tRNA ligase subunit beta [bacterium]|nr:phenylalanine--tRNA ligase subunit beta [bacterium]
MLAPLSWLKEYTKITTSPEKLAEKLLLSGTKVEEIQKANGETVFNLEITSNRPDTLSIYGVAREIAVVTKQDLLALETEFLLPPKKLGAAPSLKILDKKLCPYYTYGLIENISIGPSPTWLAERLKLVGIRPLNNVVDVTNYVMHETGQPMHAFDFDKVEGEIFLRAAKEGESVKTLDGIERKLKAGSIIIEDSKKLIDLAGIMGGENSEIDEGTKRVFLHVPIYDPVAIRRTSQNLGLRTEASNRFEKKLDPAGHLRAFERAVKLLNETTGATLASEPKSLVPEKETKISFNLLEVEKNLGIEIKTTAIVNILSSLGFQVSEDPFKEETLNVIVPSWRTDIEQSIDLVEEIGRIWGYNFFPKALPRGEPPTHPDAFEFDWEGCLVERFKASGYNQTMTYTLLSPSKLKQAKFDLSEVLKVDNPMSEDFEYLRPSLLPELFAAVEKNQRSEKEISFFEIGRVFASGEALPNQPKILSFVTTNSFLKAKGALKDLLNNAGQSTERLTKDGIFSSKVSFEIGKMLVSEVGSVNADILKNFEIGSPLIGGTVYLENLARLPFSYHYEALEKFPPIIEDLSMFISKEVPAGEVLKVIRSNNLIKEVEVFDIFEEKERKSVAVRITYQAKDRTLTDQEVSKVRKQLSRKLEKSLQAKIRTS